MRVNFSRRGREAIVFLVLAWSLVACGHSQASSAPRAVTPLGAVPTANPATPASQRSLFADPDKQAAAVKQCLVSGPRDAEGQRLCIAEAMSATGAPQEAIDFFSLSGTWLASFVGGPGRMAGGLTLAPSKTAVAPQLVFLNGSPRVQSWDDLFKEAFPPDPNDDAAAFRSDGAFPRLEQAAGTKLSGGDDPFDLKLFDDNVIESINSMASGEEFVIESGIHNFCHDCGIGVAARFAFDFDAGGKPAGVHLLSLCQGRPVTEEVAGAGKATFHDFSGVKLKPGGGGVTEPYFVQVPGLETCPQHLDF